MNETNWCQQLYESEAAKLLLYGRALGLSHSEAEDVCHETFVALMKLERRPDHPLHYCMRGFRNRALNYKRSLFRRLAREFEARRWFERAPDETPQERAAMLAMARLPQEQREVLVLKIWHQYTFEQIGQLLEASPNTVAGRYRYGLQKLRTWMKEQHYEESGFTGESTALVDASAAFGETWPAAVRQ